MYYPHLSVVLISVSVILPLLAFVAVGLRIKARYVKKTRLNASDYTIFIACVGLPIPNFWGQLPDVRISS